MNDLPTTEGAAYADGMPTVSCRSLSTTGPVLVLDGVGFGPAAVDGAATSIGPQRHHRRGWLRPVGTDLWEPARAVLPRPAGARILDLDAVDGDPAALAFDDDAFDAAVSAFGPMFASDGSAAIDELFRVVRPGGSVAFTAWTPIGAIGRLLRLAATHDPLPRGVPEPLTWGREERLREELDLHGADVRLQARELALRFSSSEEAVERLCDALAPLAVAPRQVELRRLARGVVEKLALVFDDGIELRSRYLLAVAERS